MLILKEHDLGKYSTLTALNNFRRFNQKFIPRYIFISGLILGVAFLTVAYAEMLRRIINAATNKDTVLLVQSILIMIGINLMDFIFKFSKNVGVQILNNLSTYHIQSLLIKKVLKIKIKELDANHSSDIIYRLQESSTKAQAGMNTTLFDLFGNIIQIIFMLTYLSFLDPVLTLGSIVIGFVVPTLIKNKGAGYNRNHYDRIQRTESEMQAFAQDSLQGNEIVKTYSLEDQMSSRYRKFIEKRLETVKKTILMQSFVSRMHTFSKIYGLVFIFSYGGYQVLNGSMDIGALIAFSVSYHQAILPISNISSTWINLQQSISNAQRVLEMMVLDEEDINNEQLKIENCKGTSAIIYSDVTFSFESSQVLNGVSFIAKKGSTTAIVGPSGSGKTTLFKILQRFYEKDSGDIFIENQPIEEVPIDQLRQSIAVVEQDPYLFSGTIYDNISFGKPSATNEEIVQAAKSANIHDFICSTKNKYQTVIGERGITLSGGEKQRISIARAFLKDSNILLLDEPTASLDSESEGLIQNSLERLMKDRITLIIAHRLSTIKNADNIIYLENGIVVESGTHEELISLKGKYNSSMNISLVS